MAADFLGVDYESIVVGYHNEKLPLELTQKKMLPIVELNNKQILNESLDIVKVIDKDRLLYNDDFITRKKEVEAHLAELSPSLFKLSMPYMIWTPEFSPEAREYFQKKKEITRGPFNELVLKRSELEDQFNSVIKMLELKIEQFYQSTKFGLNDILLASHLWSMYLVPEFQFSNKMHEYLMRVKKITNFEYHIDYWKKPLDWSEFWQSL